MKKLIALGLALFAAAAFAASEEDLLEADQAFALTTRVVDAHTLEASWKIAPGYYMYRDKFRFEVREGAATLKPAQFPAGKRKKDPSFGTVETYEHAVAVRLPLERKNNDAGRIRLRIVAQGCNEPVGVCYPPVTKEVNFTLPAAGSASAGTTQAALSDSGFRRNDGSTRSGAFARLVASTSGGNEEPPDPEQVFVVSVARAGESELSVRFDIDECCYLYRDKIRLELVNAGGTKLGDYQLPPGKPKKDEFLGQTEVYVKPFELRVPVTNLAGTTGAALKVGYQGCAEKPVAICYPPTTKSFALTSLASNDADTPKPTGGTGNGKFLAYVAGAFGIGLLLTFTPCVLPMIPILSSAIVGTSDRHVTKLEGGLLSTAYVLGTATTYTVAGVLAGATGEQLQAYLQNPWAIGTFAVLLALLAASMFGLYELQLPSFLQTHLHQHSHHAHSRFRHVKGGAFMGLFFMGLVSALIVGACVSPLLISALGVAIANRDPALGGAIMFAMALGMGVILIAIGIGAGFLLPKAGHWMNQVKHAFGVMLLGVAIYLLGFIPQFPVLLAWAALLIVVAVYLGATQRLPAGASGLQYLWKGVGTVALLWGIAALLGGFAGNRDILSPLPLTFTGGGIAIGSSAPSAPAAHLFERVTSLRALEERLAQAMAAGKPAILDYYADWCTDCLRMEKTTFADPGVRAELERRFVLLQADVTDPNDAEVKAMKSRFGVFGPPAMLFFRADGEEQRELRTYGFRSVEEFLKLIEGL
jgi:thiol:disulfide interchange protein DsbD